MIVQWYLVCQSYFVYLFYYLGYLGRIGHFLTHFVASYVQHVMCCQEEKNKSHVYEGIYLRVMVT